MDAITTTQASQNLDALINRVIVDLEPTILCNDKGQRAVLMSLEEFNSWQETLDLVSKPTHAKPTKWSKIVQSAQTDSIHLGKQTSKEIVQKLKIGLFLLAYLKAELSLGEFAELMNMEYLEAREWLTHLGIPMMRQKSPELESVMQDNLQKFMQRRGLNRGE